MDIDPDGIAGVVDIFGALPPATLREGLAELAFKRGVDRDPTDFEPDVQAAIDTYHLLALENDLLVVGPVAFPSPPEDAPDLLHILDAEERTIDSARLADAGERRFRADAGQAVADGDEERIRRLLDVSYELEAWAPVELGETRERLENALEGN